MTASEWTPVPDIVGPCAGIVFERPMTADLLNVTMLFSLVSGLPNRDLRLQFTRPLLLKWEQECPGLELVPKKLPKCSDPQWSGWTFPLLKVEGAEWMDLLRTVYQDPGEKYSHFLLVSMGDLVQVVAESAVSSEWVIGSASEAESAQV